MIFKLKKILKIETVYFYTIIILRTMKCQQFFFSHGVGKLVKLFLLALLFFSSFNLNAELNPQKIRVVMDNNYPPYTFLDENGEAVGILIDQWRLWQKKTGIIVELVTTKWEDALERMRLGEFDVIDTVFYTQERDKWLSYSKPYAKIEVPLFVARELSGISGFETLKGFIVAAKKGDAVVEVLNNNGIKNLILYDNYDEIIKAAIENKLSIFTVDKPPALYYIRKYDVTDSFKEAFLIDIGWFHRAVLKNNTELLKLVEAGFEKISKAEFTAIEEKWSGKSLLTADRIKFFVILITLLTAMIVLFYIFNVTLRRKVNRIVTELSKSREKFFAIFDQGQNIEIILSLEGRILEVNQKALEFCPVSRNNFLHQYIWELPCWKKSSKDIFELQKIFLKGVSQKLFNFEAEFDFRENRKAQIFFSLLPIVNDRKETLFFLLQGRDISELKAAQQDQLELEQQLLNLQKIESIGLFCSGIVYNFNNMLMVIIGNLDLALKRLTDSGYVREKILTAISSAQSGAEVINKLISFTGKKSPEYCEIFFDQLIKENSQFFRTFIPDNIELEFDVQENVPLIIGDPVQIRQMLMSLLMNSVEAIGRKSGKIKVVAGKIFLTASDLKKDLLANNFSAGEYFVIKVEDNGSGIKPENIKKIIDPFFSTRGSGRGLGMSTVAGIVKAHNGGLLISSSLNRGTTVQIVFPQYMLENEKKIKQGRTEAIAEYPGVDLSGTKVLIIDDDLEIRLIVAEILKDKGASVFQAADGKEALKIVSQYGDDIGLIIIDHFLPEQDGAVTLKQIRSVNSKAKVIVSSGADSGELQEYYQAFQVSAFLNKPYFPDDLKAVIDKIFFHN